MGYIIEISSRYLHAHLALFIAEQKRIWHFSWLEIEKEHILTTAELPVHHKDPFDRLLAAQALRENMAILTPDEHIRKYPVECIW